MNKLNCSKTAILLFSFFVGTLPLNAQWTDVGTFNQSMNDLKSYSNQLWIGGNFTKVNNMTCYWSAAYDGASYSLHTNLIGGIGIKRFEVFNGTLFSAGGMDFKEVSSWDGSTWVSEANINESCTGIYADGNDLFVGSDFGQVFKRTGSGGVSPLPSFNDNDDINAFAKFNGQIIVAGKFGSVGGTAFNNIAAWNGSSWIPLGTGLNGVVSSLAVYKNELYAAGNFSTAGGQSANYIAKWNGSIWSAVGGSVTGTGFNGLRDMAVAGNNLFVAGDFTKVGNVTTKGVAYWNGSNWTGMNFTESSDFPNCIESFDGKIYIGTLSFTASKLFRFDGTVSAHEPVAALEFLCAPNPASDQVEISLSDPGNNQSLNLKILDAAGRLVLEDKDFRQSARYSCAAWPVGIYQVVLSNASGQVRGEERLVKQ
ncbi:MAG: T9SS type A sorting domain-containing protein [Saprospiraceae bacterium]|nr:T9SS type A sorting domain-containing protein [Saprospiraceae bacterium]